MPQTTNIENILDELYEDLNHLFNEFQLKFENEQNQTISNEYAIRSIQVAEIQKMLIDKKDEVKERYKRQF